MTDWPAPSTSEPVNATVTVPGSKSLTNRALILAALAASEGESTVGGALRSRDTDLMIGALQALGLTVTGDTDLTIGGAIAPAPGTRIGRPEPNGSDRPTGRSPPSSEAYRWAHVGCSSSTAWGPSPSGVASFTSCTRSAGCRW